MERNVLEPQKIDWVLVDDSNAHFDIWQANVTYRECFAKGEDPNKTKLFGQHTEAIKYRKDRGINYKKDVKKWLGDENAD